MTDIGPDHPVVVALMERYDRWTAAAYAADNEFARGSVEYEHRKTIEALVDAGFTITRPAVVVVWLGENGNDIAIFPADAAVRIIEVDCGYAALTDRDEFLGWAGSQFGEVDDLTKEHGPDHPAIAYILAIVEGWRGRCHRDLADLDAVRHAATSIA